MKNDKQMLIAIDLDDTILDDLFSLNARSVCALIDAQEMGHIVMLATARSKHMAFPYYQILGLQSPLSLLNGAVLYHPGNAAFPEYDQRISAVAMAELSNCIERLHCTSAWIENNDEVFVAGRRAERHQYFREVFRHANVSACSKLPAVAAARVNVCVATEKDALELAERMKKYPDVQCRMFRTGSDPVRLNFCSVRADKWFTVQYTAAYYGIPEDRIIAFGDEENDRKMLFQAGHGFVMCNGNKRMRADARRSNIGITALSCREGGVGYELERLLDLKTRKDG